jgi:hypothetical protein
VRRFRKKNNFSVKRKKAKMDQFRIIFACSRRKSKNIFFAFFAFIFALKFSLRIKEKKCKPKISFFFRFTIFAFLKSNFFRIFRFKFSHCLKEKMIQDRKFRLFRFVEAKYFAFFALRDVHLPTAIFPTRPAALPVPPAAFSAPNAAFPAPHAAFHTRPAALPAPVAAFPAPFPAPPA